MRKKRALKQRILAGICTLAMYQGVGWLIMSCDVGRMSYHVYAQNQSAQYIYDSLGRIVSVLYPNGLKIVYHYDANGNLLSVEKTVWDTSQVSGGTDDRKDDSGNGTGETSADNDSGSGAEDGNGVGAEDNPGTSAGNDSGSGTGKDAGNEAGQGSGGGAEGDSGSGSGGDTDSGHTGSGEAQSVTDDGSDGENGSSAGDTGNSQEDVSQEQMAGDSLPSDISGAQTTQELQAGQKTAADAGYSPNPVKSYSKFKKKKAVLRSLTLKKEKKKRYLKVVIRQLYKKGKSVETGYQIKYAPNEKFKKSKTIDVNRKKNRYTTSKKWKVKKGKTWYVKVRAFRKTAAGKTIYSKYSRVKKVKS